MTENFDDKLAHDLARLESDLNGVGLPGASSARRRAAQRTRHQMISGVFAAATAIAVGVVVATGQVSFTASPEPVAPPTDSPSPTAGAVRPSEDPTRPPPSADPTPSGENVADGGSGGEQPLRPFVPPGALLTADDIARQWVEWVEVPAGSSWLPCGPAIPSTATAVSFETPDGSSARVDQFVEPTAPGAASDRLGQLRQEITGCAETLEDDGALGLFQVWSLGGVGDEAYLFAYSGPSDVEFSQTYVTASLVRTGDYVTVVLDGGPGQDYNGAAQPDIAISAADRLCSALGGDCTGSVERERLVPEPLGDVPGWLTVEDVVAATGLEEIGEGGAPADQIEFGQGWGHVVLSRDPLADGATTLDRRSYFDPLQPTSEIDVSETLARFASVGAARAHYDALVAEAGSAIDTSQKLTTVGRVDGTDYTGTAWILAGDDGYTSYVGAVTRGNHVAVVVPSSMVDLSGEQFLDLLDRAGQRLGE